MVRKSSKPKNNKKELTGRLDRPKGEKRMTTREILNNIEIQVEYVLVYYDSEKEQRFKLEECPFSHSIEIKYMYIENGTLFFELDEWE